ncbi:MAG: hypothetical protein E6R09_05910 [Rhodocyclaceae bacterium]|nr:MAG: hypothetical protein E6R09_05910 [Rhodocyclaceae bacterium]
MYLRERLAQKLIQSYKPRLPSPLHIAVGGGKGGSGASTVALSLAVAAKDIGYRAAYLAYENACNASYALAQQVTDFHVGVIEKSDYKPESFDFIFVDVPARILTPQNPDYKKISDFVAWADLLVLPINLDGVMDREVALNAFKTLDALPSTLPWMALQCGTRLDLASLMTKLEEIQPWMRLLCSRPVIYSTMPIKFKHDIAATWEFVHDDAAGCFYDILQNIAERLSVSLHESTSLHQARALSVKELVEQLTRR